MTWRAPIYSLSHALRAAGSSAISTSVAAETGYPVTNLLDDRGAALFKFSTDAAAHYIQVDRGGSLTAADAIDRAWIPAGHNLEGSSIRVRSSSVVDFASDVTTLLAEDAIVASSGEGVDRALTESHQRYVRLDWPTSSGKWELGELVLTYRNTLERGPESGWEDNTLASVLVNELRSGASARVVTGANRRQLIFQYRGVSATADLATLDAIAEDAGKVPILVDPPFGASPPDDASTLAQQAVWCFADTVVSRRQEPLLPAATDTPRTEYTLALIENVS